MGGFKMFQTHKDILSQLYPIIQFYPIDGAKLLMASLNRLWHLLNRSTTQRSWPRRPRSIRRDGPQLHHLVVLSGNMKNGE